MPELAEVEYYRQVWNPGLGAPITAVKMHPEKRIFRGTPVEKIRSLLPGAILRSSEARGKQMLFSFSNGLWLGLHLGMSGKLSVATADLHPGKHDHLVLLQKKRALVFTDPRQFGRVRFHAGPEEPDWWTQIPPAVTSRTFRLAHMTAFLGRHPKLPIKATLLLQAGFPGIGNWMADEILWRARVDPRTPSGRLAQDQIKALWRSLRFVARQALKHVGRDFSDPPKGWLFHQRWKAAGTCPRDGTTLCRETIGGRTTAWCAQCQPS